MSEYSSKSGAAGSNEWSILPPSSIPYRTPPFSPDQGSAGPREWAVGKIAPYREKIPEAATLFNPVRNETYKFPLNINSVVWQYDMNTQSYDTLGGRVIQLLSVKIGTLQVAGEAGGAPTSSNRAGAGLKNTGRKALLDLYTNFKKAQDDQNQTKRPMTFSVPSRGLSWSVWLREMQLGWDTTTISYPYTMSLEVDQDFSKGTMKAATDVALSRLQNGVGYKPEWLGFSSIGTSMSFQDLVDAGLFSNSNLQ